MPSTPPPEILIFRFVDKSSTIREEFVSFSICSYGLSGQSLFNAIKEFSNSKGIDFLDCRGKGYDGTGTVTGKNQDLAAHVLRIISKILYMHCYYECLNLAVVTFCGEQRIRNVMIDNKEISFFQLVCATKQLFEGTNTALLSRFFKT